MAKTLIKGGTVVTAADTMDADVLIEDDKVVAIYARDADGVMDRIAGAAVEAGASTVIDATGKYVIPGAIDVHTHFELPFGGTFVSDSCESGTRAAPHGGTTTIIDYPVQTKCEPMRAGCDTRIAKA